MSAPSVASRFSLGRSGAGLKTEGSAGIAGLGARSSRAGLGLRFVEVADDRMEPMVRRGDFALVAEVGGWRGEGEYLVAVADQQKIYSFAADGTLDRPLRQYSANRLYRHERLLSSADFEAIVVAKVVMACAVKEPTLLRELALT